MKTQTLMLCCQHHQSPQVDWQPVIDAIPCLCWGILGLLAFYFLLRFVIAPIITNCHEREEKESVHQRELEWADKKKTADDSALDRKRREFEEITIQQKILDKVLNANTDQELSTLKQSVESLKSQFENYKGEIEAIIIKKK